MKKIEKKKKKVGTKLKRGTGKASREEADEATGAEEPGPRSARAAKMAAVRG